MARKTQSRSGKNRSTKPQSTRSKTQTRAAAPVATAAPATSSVEAKPFAQPISAQAVAEAAYFLWLERGGNEVVNWLEAEAMIVRQNGR